ncbi:heme-binding protein [Pseudomonas chlororaphis]|uniref:GlcG/HbpS family heme-binding protein n=1 Tax=Pseudomonas chlororaphis TaxID=587753 RepID=UPI0030D18069
MGIKQVLSNNDVEKIAAAAKAHALKNQWPVTIALFDDGGHLLHLTRLDGASPMTVEMAMAKGRTAAISRRESKFYEDLILVQKRLSFLSAPLSGFLEGGVPITLGSDVVGAISVSGVTSQQDAQVAFAGLAALSQAPQTPPQELS